MIDRRKFLKLTGMGSLFLLGAKKSPAKAAESTPKKVTRPVVISTWNHGVAANAAAWKILADGGAALDAVEAGVRVVESDPLSTSVGLGGLPDRDGRVTLDACIMDHLGNCGGVACLEHIENPVSVARKVMEDTPHVLIVGQGALEFALSKGFQRTNLLTPASEREWRKWLKTSQYKPIINIENHDTIGMLAIDASGNISGSCTTSGLAYKLHGRVGDSPIIGAGLYVDNEIGGACATGVGEAVIKIVGSHLVVELMRQGKSPQKACEMAVNRLIEKIGEVRNMQVGFLAINKRGETGAYSVYQGFNFAYTSNEKNELIDAAYDRTW